MNNICWQSFVSELNPVKSISSLYMQLYIWHIYTCHDVQFNYNADMKKVLDHICTLPRINQWVSFELPKYIYIISEIEKKHSLLKTMQRSVIFHSSSYKHTSPLPPRTEEEHIFVRNIFPICILIVTSSRELCMVKLYVFF